MTFDDLCHLCDVDYDLVAKVEMLSADAGRLLPTLFNEDAMSWKQPADTGRRVLLPTLNTGRVGCGRCTVVERRSLAGEFSPSCARLAADG